METAPFLSDVAEGPDGGGAYWLDTSDNVRVRIAVWGQSACKGTVLLFPGRTEYAEKYGRAADDLAQRGFATVAVDWRGQGLADRLTADRMIGHVGRFADYQKDVKAVLDAAATLDLPRPWYLLAHSMGGAIGLRALHEKLPVAAACFSAPMWGILMSPITRPLAWGITWLSGLVGSGERLAPSTRRETYVLAEPFKDNMLTTDRDMFDYMRRQVAAHPDLALGGPSMNWLYEALSETRELAARPAPHMPTITFLGSNERIIDPARIHPLMDNWPGGQIRIIQNGEHEVLMETPDMRDRVFDDMAGFFEKHTGHS